MKGTWRSARQWGEVCSEVWVHGLFRRKEGTKPDLVDRNAGHNCRLMYGIGTSRIADVYGMNSRM